MFFSLTLFIAMLTSRNIFLFKKQARICEGDENMGMWTQVILCLINCERSGWNECDPCGYIINKISFLEKEVIPCSNESLPGSVYYFHKTTGWNGIVLEWLDRVPRGLNGFVFTQIHRSAKTVHENGLQDACGEKYLLLGEFEAVSGHWALLTELLSLGFIGLLLRIQNGDGLKRCNLD